MKRRGKPEAFRCECGNHSWAPITRGFVTLVCPDDEHFLLEKFWQAHVHPNGDAYVRTDAPRVKLPSGIKRKTIWLHREVIGLPNSMVDHRNWVTTDNRRPNLRPANKSLNAANARRVRAKSGYKGVTTEQYADGEFYLARINDPKCRVIGCYGTLEEAARAYDQAALAAFGEFAVLNFPSDPSCIASAEAEIARRDCPAPPAKPSKADAELDLFGEAA